MNTFLFGLFSNLALLAIVIGTCHLYNRMTPGAAVNGGYAFAMLVSVALLLDTLLTFVVFADAQRRYGAFSATAAFLERAGGYVIVTSIALVYARIHARSVPRVPDVQPARQDVVVIRTSAYSESHLRM